MRTRQRVADPTIKVTIQGVQGIPYTGGCTCNPFVVLQVGEQSLKSGVSIGTDAVWHQTFHLQPTGRVLSMVVYNRRLFGLLGAGDPLCRFELKDLHCLPRNRPYRLELEALDHPGTTVTLVCLAINCGLDIEKAKAVEKKERQQRLKILEAEEAAAEQLVLLQEQHHAALEQYLELKERLFEQEAECRERVANAAAEFLDKELSQFAQQHLQCLETDERNKLLQEVTEAEETLMQGWQELQEVLAEYRSALETLQAEEAEARRTIEEDCSLISDLVEMEIAQRLALMLEEENSLQEITAQQITEAAAIASSIDLVVQHGELEDMEKEERAMWYALFHLQQKQVLESSHTAQKKDLISEEIFTRLELQFQESTEWVALVNTEQEERKCIEHRLKMITELLAEEENARNTLQGEWHAEVTGLNLTQQTLNLISEEEATRPLLDEEWAQTTHALFHAIEIEHLLSLEEEARKTLLTDLEALQKFESEFQAVVQENDIRWEMETFSTATLELLCECASGVGHLLVEEGEAWRQLWTDFTLQTNLLLLQEEEVAARNKLEARWWKRWCDAHLRLNIFNIEVANWEARRALFVEEVATRKTLTVNCNDEKDVVSMVLEECDVRKAICVECIDVFIPWWAVHEMLLDMWQRFRGLQEHWATSREELEKGAEMSWSGIWCDGMYERGTITTVEGEDSDRHVILAEEDAIFERMRKASHDEVRVIHQRYRDMIAAEEAAERIALEEAQNRLRRKMECLVLLSLPQQILLTCQLKGDFLASYDQRDVKDIVVASDSSLRTIREEAEKAFNCRLQLFIHRNPLADAFKTTIRQDQTPEDHLQSPTQSMPLRPHSAQPVPAVGGALRAARKLNRAPPDADLQPLTNANYHYLLIPLIPHTSCDPTPVPAAHVLYCRPLYPGVMGVCPPSNSEAWQAQRERKRAAMVRLQNFRRIERLLEEGSWPLQPNPSSCDRLTESLLQEPLC